MSAARLGWLKRGATLVPLALISAAWTVSLTTAGATVATAAETTGVLPDGTTIPSHAVQAPASVSAPAEFAPGVKGSASNAVSTASANGIPSAALVAYQRAETVINAADKSCHLPWQLVAAIGRVESDHGRTNGNVLTNKGIATPGIFGLPLNGKSGTSLIRDTDTGLLDHDKTFDRAVGPMQFIPSTWSIVGVDADGDGQRNPQDINDAALATAVYLCSGTDDLSTTAGQRASVLRYNHSQQYVDLVLAIMRAYMSGDFTSVPNGTSVTGFIPPAPGFHPGSGSGGHGTHHATHGGHGGPGTGTHAATGGGNGTGTTTTTGPTATPTATATPTQAPTQVPTQAPTSSPTSSPTSLPTSLPTTLPTHIPTTAPTAPTSVPTSVPTLLTTAEAKAECAAQGLDPVLDKAAFDQCVHDLTH